MTGRTFLSIAPDAKFSARPLPTTDRQPRDLAAAVTRLTKLQNPSRIEPRS